MTEPSQTLIDERFLVCAPTGRDGSLTRTLLEKSGIAAHVCSDIGELLARAEHEGCAGLLLAEEVLGPAALNALRELLQRQESWSDLPILLFTRRAELPPSLLRSLGNVTLLERPLRPITMSSAVRSALRSRRRQYEGRAELLEQQRAVRRRDQFLAMLGHELRNPLAAIAMAIKLDDAAPAASPYRAIVERQTMHLTRLVDDLLDVARVTSGKIMLRQVTLDLVELLERCADGVRSTLEAQELSLELELPSPPVLVDGDPIRLEQVVVNLINNAAKYTPKGGHICVAVTMQADEVTISVCDDGVGIAPDMLPRVFDLFTQVESTLDRAKGGMGIGLTLVRSLVELHGGRVEAASPGSNQGSTFTVRLPRSAKDKVHPPAPRRAAERAGNGVRSVLIVEDSSDSRELLRMGLSRHGHRLSVSGDGLEGVEIALRERPDAMLVDIGLPGIDGYGVARRVRAALGRSIYLIALTGYGQPEDRRRALDAGFDIHLTKPVDLVQLDDLLRGEAPAP